MNKGFIENVLFIMNDVLSDYGEYSSDKDIDDISNNVASIMRDSGTMGSHKVEEVKNFVREELYRLL